MSKVDELVKTAEIFERLALYGDRKTFIKSLAQDAGWYNEEKREGDIPEDHAPPAPQENTVLQLPEQTIVGKKPTHQSDPATVKLMQIFLNNACRAEIQAGKLGPIQQDGIIGPETIGRMQLWAKKNNVGTQDLASLEKLLISKTK